MLFEYQDTQSLKVLNYRLRERRLLITGGSGYFARTMISLLDGFADISYERMSRSNGDIVGDLGDERFTATLNGNWTDIIHTAGPLPDPLGKQDDIHKSIVNLARQALHLARNNRVKRFMLMSSGAVYGTSAVSPISEDQILAPSPESGYASGKADVERMAVEFCAQHGIELVVVRAFAFSGSGLPFDHPFALAEFMRSALCEGKIVLRGPPDVERSFMDSEDLAIWLLTILTGASSGSIYNVGSDQPLQMQTLLEKLTGLLPGVSVEYLNGRLKPGSSRSYFPSTAKARRELNLEAHVPFDISLRRTLEGFRVQLGRMA